jgi:hypothetical protein
MKCMIEVREQAIVVAPKGSAFRPVQGLSALMVAPTSEQLCPKAYIKFMFM